MLQNYTDNKREILFTPYVYTENKTVLFHSYLGALGYELSSINIILSAVIILQNILVIECYIEQRAKFSAAMYIAIAIVDTVVAHGAIVMSVAGMLICYRGWDMRYLYYCLYYCIATAGFAQTCSKFYSAMLSTVMTILSWNPFRRLNFRKIRVFITISTVMLFIVCLCDSIVLVYFEMSGYYKHFYEYHILIPGAYGFPGFVSLAGLACAGFPSKIFSPDFESSATRLVLSIAGGSLFVLVVILPPLVYLVSAILMTVFLKRAVREQDSGQLTSNVRHVSVTVILVASLSFVCNFTFAALTLLFLSFDPSTYHAYPNIFARGRIFGIALFTLPLVNAALFPMILIKRNPTLRQRFVRILTRTRDSLIICCAKFRGIPGPLRHYSNPCRLLYNWFIRRVNKTGPTTSQSSYNDPGQSSYDYL